MDFGHPLPYLWIEVTCPKAFTLLNQSYEAKNSSANQEFCIAKSAVAHWMLAVGIAPGATGAFCPKHFIAHHALQTGPGPANGCRPAGHSHREGKRA